MAQTTDEHSTDAQAARHRAKYILERGVWHGSCQVCTWEDTDVVRRRLASRFRFHLRPPNEEDPAAV